ncbi:MAG TPA: OsmC family protein [Streptosporangiaceae bacterium]|nr:OsmC family protein [Streptosporangiaceae bacterium]
MNKAAIRAGVGGGILGGLVMAIWLTSILWLTGTGFWTLLNLIANTFWRAAPLGPQFNVLAVVIGLVVHLLMSMLFGVLIAAAAWRLPAPRSLVIAAGALFGSVLWAVMQYGIWRAADPAAARVVTPWLFASAHLLFGLIVAAMAAIVIPDEEIPVAGRLLDTSMSRQHSEQAAAADRPAPHVRTLVARSEGGMRTVIRTRDGLGVVLDETPDHGGSRTAPTPLENVIAALCGCAGATFAAAARELGFGYDGIDFEAVFTQDPRGAAGEPGVRPHFQNVRVQARVLHAEPDAWLPDVVRITERRSPVRNLLADAGVALEMTWTAVPRESSHRRPRNPEYLPRQ